MAASAKPHPQQAVGHRLPDQPVAYNRRDVILYALGVGAHALRFTYELDPEFAALPTYALVAGSKGTSVDITPFSIPDSKDPTAAKEIAPGIPVFDTDQILHGEQSLEILRPLPCDGVFTMQSKVVGVWDKGKGMLFEIEQTLVDAQGQPYARMVAGTFVRGLGGFGGMPQPKRPAIEPPARAADAVELFTTSPQQAALYRLSGNYHPLHIDPDTAAKVGLPMPILHGLCSYGISVAQVLQRYGGNNPARLVATNVRFVAPVFPGETLATAMWDVGGGTTVIFQTTVPERDNVVVLRGSVTVTVTGT